jgi:hypothetical protein
VYEVEGAGTLAHARMHAQCHIAYCVFTGSDKPPPMMSRLAAGMRKSLTNLLNIFGGVSAEP